MKLIQIIRNIVSLMPRGRRLREGKPTFAGFTLYIVSLLVFPLIISCSDDLRQEKNENETYDGMEKITFSIPNMNYNLTSYTRAIDTSLEGNITNLYVIAIKTKDVEYNDRGEKIGTPTSIPDDEQVVQVFSLGISSMEVGSQEYKDYQVELYPGFYKFYVLANINMYLDRYGSVANITKESQIKDLYLHFTENNPLEVEHLPMACFPYEIKTSANGNAVGINGQEIEINKTKYISGNTVSDTKFNNTGIWADLQFLCSKVRFTILYNNTPGGCSEAFGRYSIRFNVDYNTHTAVTYLRDKTYLDKDHAWTKEDLEDIYVKSESPYLAYPEEGEPVEMDNAYWHLNLERCRFKEGKEFNEWYPVSPDDDSIELWPFSKEEWEQKTDQRVWQGVCYLPENKTTEGVNHTLLAFPFTIDEWVTDARGNTTLKKNDFDDRNFKMVWLFGNNGESHYNGGSTSSDNYETSGNNDGNNHGLERNHFYDVVAKVMTPNDLEMYFQVEVNVMSWTKHGETEITDW